MSVLAVITGPLGKGREALEFLRLVAALVAHGQSVRLVVLATGPDGLATDDLHEDVERHLEALAAFDVLPTALPAAELATALAEAGSILRFAPIDRPGEPVFLRAGAATTAEALGSAGQVVAEG